jgi:tetratricopeptide (TPR) repeat protein
VKVLETAIRIDELQLDGEGVVNKLREIAAVERHEGADALATFLFGKAAEFYDRGDQRGENPALLMAIAIFREALDELSRERAPENWAMVQNDLGNALVRLGERESGTARLEEAVSAYRAALEEHKRERVPMKWATTQNNLGVALQTLGERGTGTSQLVEAVEAYRKALEERTRERTPLEWAMTQNNLGTALQFLSQRKVERLG